MTSSKLIRALHRVCFLIIICLLVASVATYAQDAGGVVNWNIEANTMDVKLPTDLPFVLNMTNIPDGTTLARVAIYELGEQSYPSIKALISGSTKVFDDKIVGSTIVVPARLKFDTDYFLSLYELKPLTSQQSKEFASSEEYRRAKDSIYKLIEEVVRSRDPEKVDEFLNMSFHSKLEVLAGKLKYTYIRPKPSNEVFMELSNAIRKSSNLLNGDSSELITITDEEKSVLTELIIKLMNAQMGLKNLLRTTYSSSIESRVLDRLYMTFAFGGVYENNAYLFTAIGFNYYFCGFNPRVPISKVQDGFGRRWSAHFSTTVMTPSFIDGTRASGILGGENINLGVGCMVADGVVLNAGGQLYNKSKQNPLITKSSLCMRPFLSISFDSRLRTLLNS